MTAIPTSIPVPAAEGTSVRWPVLIAGVAAYALGTCACGAPPSSGTPPASGAPSSSGGEGSATVAEDAEGDSRTLASVFSPPEGYERAPTDAFGNWLRRLALRPEGVPVKTHEGTVVPQARAVRVVEMPLVKGDLQQCADSAIRLRAGWLRETGQEEAIVFHATSGDPMPWSRYRQGERAYAVGNALKWRRAEPASWDTYLSAVFTWAGTRSLAYDTVPARRPGPGDLLVLPGSPGHAVVILDVATRGADTVLLVGEGFMPAQDFHVEPGPHDGWWAWEPGLRMAPWTFPASSLRRWKP